MFKGKQATTIVKVTDSVFAVGTDGDGLHIVNMDDGQDKLHLLQGTIIKGMAFVGKGEVLIGAGEEKDSKLINCAFHLVDTLNGLTRKMADTEDEIASIQLLSQEYTLALSLNNGGNVMMINYATGNVLLLITIMWNSYAAHWNSLLQVIPPQKKTDNYIIICRDGKEGNEISKFELNKEFTHMFK